MGTLSGGGKEVISVGERCLLGANAGIGISLGDDCVVEAGCYVTAGTKVTLPGRHASSRPASLRRVQHLLFRRNSVTGAVEVRAAEGHAASSSTPPCTRTTDPQLVSSTETPVRFGHGLKVRHLTMMGLGSAIGAGLFLGTGVGIAKAGPAVLISYVIAGFIVVCVMRMLGEMGAALPASGSFSHYARIGIGEWAGFVMGWLYWFMLIMVLGAEITGASAIVNDWMPGVPQWVVALVFVTFFAVVNLAKVSNFGEFEFWFAAIKVAAIIGFLVIGVLLVFGLLPDTDPVGFTNLFGQGGFMPNGFAGIAAGLLVVAFAFGGIEIVTIAAAESEGPRALDRHGRAQRGVAHQRVLHRLDRDHGAWCCPGTIAAAAERALRGRPDQATSPVRRRFHGTGGRGRAAVGLQRERLRHLPDGVSRSPARTTARRRWRGCPRPACPPMRWCCRCSSASSVSC